MNQINHDDLKNRIRKSGDFTAESKMYLEKLLEKQNPKMLDYEGDGYDDNGELIYDIAFCPVCRHYFEYELNDWGCKYCCDCGQTLDWRYNND